jgi:RNA polymerase sigma-70 factor (ECF subfamily)
MSKTKTGVFRTVSRLNRMLLFFAFPLAAYTMMMGRNQTPSDEADLVNRARQGDDDAFAELYRRYYEPLVRYLFNMVHNLDDAHDLTALTLTQAWYRLSGLKDAERFRAWLYKIAHRIVLDFLRQKKAHKYQQPEPLDDNEDCIDEVGVQFVELLATWELLRQALDELPNKEQQCLLLYIYGLRPEEIAYILDIKPTSVGAYISNARRKIQRFFREMKDDES